MSLKEKSGELITDNRENALSLSNVDNEVVSKKDVKEKKTLELILAENELAHNAELIILNKKLMLSNKLEKLARRKYIDLYNLATTGYLTLTRKGKIIESNQLASQILGKKFTVLKDCWFSTFVSDNTKPIFNHFLEQVFKSKTNQLCDVTLLTDDDKMPKYALLIGIVIKNSKYCFVSMVDITQRKLVEKDLAESHLFNLQIINSVEEGIIVYDRNLCVILWNSFMEQLTGIPSSQVLGKNPAKAFPFLEEVGMMESLKRTLNGKSEGPIDFPFHLHSTGKSGWTSNINVPFRDINGEIIGVIGTVHDIIDRKHAEFELIDAKEKAEESERLKSYFLTNMSHEIRTPMNGILGYTELLKDPNITGEEQQDFIRIIEKSCEPLLNIINNIGDISKIESGTMEVYIKESNINEQIEFIYNFFKPEVESKGIKFFFKSSLLSKEVTIKTDSEKVYTILINLIKNAIKFTNEGSIEFGYERKGKYLEFYVKDTGIGLSREKMNRIFERFNQSSESLSQNFVGAGLGLSLSKSYVEMLGGKIWLESEEGNGSVFYFTIPFNTVSEEKNAIKNAGPAEDKEVQIKNLKILVAEDDEISSSLFDRTLRKISREVIHAKTGVEAVEYCHNHPDLDLVLMDIRMPEIDGLEATRQIRQFNKDVIIIAQTAYGFSGDSFKAIEAGCNDYIRKPIKMTLLYKLINKHCTK